MKHAVVVGLLSLAGAGCVDDLVCRAEDGCYYDPRPICTVENGCLPGDQPPIPPPEVTEPPEDHLTTIWPRKPSGPCAEVPTCIAFEGLSSPSRIAYIPLDGSATTYGPEVQFYPGYFGAAQGRLGDDLITCTSFVTRVSLLDGYAENAPLACMVAWADPDGSIIVDGKRFESFEAIVDGEPGEWIGLDTGGNSRVGGEGEWIASAWHAATSVHLTNRVTGEVRDVELEGGEAWIMGVSVVGDRILVARGLDRADGIESYDFEGALLERIATGPLNGIQCGTGPAYCPPTGEAPERERSVQIAGNCSSEGTSSNYLRTTEGDEELHVIGVYEGDDSDHGRVHVRVHASDRPIVLALSAYDPTEWQLELDEGAHIARIITSGYDAQTVTGAPRGVAIEGHGYYLGDYETGGYGWEPEHNQGGGDFFGMMTSLRAHAGLDETSFQGCYAGATFDVPPVF